MSALNSYSSTVNSGSKVSATFGMSAGSTTVAPSRLSSAMAASATAAGPGLAPHPAPGPAKAVGVEEPAVVGEAVALGVGGGRVARVDPGHGPEDGGRVGHGAAHGAGHVLAVGDRDHPGAAGQPQGRVCAPGGGGVGGGE